MTVSEYIIENNIDFFFYEKTYENVAIKVLKYLKNIDGGVFVEIGAHDGIFQSNTKILESCGWNGLLIEPSSKLFEECKINRKCFVEKFAIVSDDYNDKFINSDNNGQLINDRKGILSMGPEHYEKCEAITFNKLNEKYKYDYIDFMSIDVEGFELDVIKGIDFKKIDIRFLLIEVNSNFYSHDEINEILIQNGYGEPINMSNFTKESCPSWPGTHQDYLYIKK
jgi:FkbM family methyltransferase